MISDKALNTLRLGPSERNSSEFRVNSKKELIRLWLWPPDRKSNMDGPPERHSFEF